jgi:hypothetical protein
VNLPGTSASIALLVIMNGNLSENIFFPNVRTREEDPEEGSVC